MFKFVHFRYRYNGALVARNKRAVQQKGGFTISILEGSNNGISIGIAKCNRSDSYSKRVGRYLSTRRAIKAAEFSNEQSVAVLSESRIPATILGYINQVAKRNNREVYIIDPICEGQSGTAD